MAANPDTPLLEVRDLRVEFHTFDGVVRAVDGVSFSINHGRTLGIVGESGSGKTVANLALMGLIPRPPGRVSADRVMFDGQDLLKLSAENMRRIRGRRIAMIFQDPMTSLNPLLRISRQLTEGLEMHLGMSRAQSMKRAVELLEMVGIPAAARRVRNYPHQFSGGMRQRVMIAMALACGPDLIIADEPTTALDVTIQAQILELLKKLQQETGTTIILITHDLGVVAGMCHDIAVMYAGKIVEKAEAGSLFARPLHPYTLGLLRSIPRLDAEGKGELFPIDGMPPDLIHNPPGCNFEPRCPFRVEKCKTWEPNLEQVEPGRFVACYVDVATGKQR
jgi:oligopeptide transport system ATP-binding protein